MVQVEADDLVRGCEEGLFEPLEQSRLGKPEDFVPGTLQDCGVGLLVCSMVLAYNPQARGSHSWILVESFGRASFGTAPFFSRLRREGRIKKTTSLSLENDTTLSRQARRTIGVGLRVSKGLFRR
ncbi:hypothetical protein ACIP1T_22255 [Pseudomonas japonica]|uniref:hypothetical protein n=1 Tax=Pseudomonas japonica TaxID=256466 RepID=UPI0038247EEB